MTRQHGPEGLPDDTVELALRGSIGQSCGAWLAPGVTIDLAGQVNDYAGKGLSGGTLIVRPPEGVPFEAEKNVIAGNVCALRSHGRQGLLPRARGRALRASATRAPTR